MFLVLIFTAQSSTLWASLIIVPLSFSVIANFTTRGVSELSLIIFVIVFVGGLIVLLLRVSAIASQEQSLSFRRTLFVIMLCLIGATLCLNTFDWILYLTRMLHLISQIKITILTIVILILLEGLVIISLVLVEFKSMVRKV